MWWRGTAIMSNVYSIIGSAIENRIQNFKITFVAINYFNDRSEYKIYPKQVKKLYVYIVFHSKVQIIYHKQQRFVAFDK